MRELKSQLYYCLDCKLIQESVFTKPYKETDIISSKIGGFIKYLNQSLIKGNKFKNRSESEIRNNKPEIFTLQLNHLLQ